MLVLAKSVKGKEFLYRADSAHKVSASSADYICKVLNERKFKLEDGSVWFKHAVDEYDTAYQYAEFQSFTNRKGIVSERRR